MSWLAPDPARRYHATGMAEKRKLVIAGFMLATILSGQSLHVAPSATDRKTPGVFPVSLESPKGREPVALQWELSIPPAIAVDAGDISAGTAAVGAGKSVHCAKRSTSADKLHYMCILAGGRSAIPNGNIFQVRYRAAAETHGAPIRVGIENVIGVFADLKRVEIPNTYAIVRILESR